ncbi:helix-turn-helix transcriptional regulator [Paenibacillus sp. FSL R7-0331]|uniref:helix-turn-helix transcriptional regulator n=1 Tax=Paenibacillus sp. FSL R7-0331 TaxID=1536773 RepID=UPI0004F5C415|nr:AraC family transcriptional regulator [Paenibacillus sp. FSL R7-0331]AIQ53764.1 transcriptional regulator [Paenibacillus sp. FSL R7-0331]
MGADLFVPHPLFYIEYMKHDAGHRMPGVHYHNCYELYILEEGHHNMLIHDSVLTLAVHDTALFKPNLFHQSYRNNGCARTCLYFTDRFLRMYFTEKAVTSLLDCFDRGVISIDRELFPRVKKLLLLLEKEDVTDSSNRIFIYLAEILDILNQSKSAPRTAQTTASPDQIDLILSYINQNYATIRKIEEIAGQFYISKYYLCHIFKEATGLTLVHYINNIRIQHACNMLVNTGRSILEIGLACGFNSSMYFCKTFKQALNVTPSEFRRTAL